MRAFVPVVRTSLVAICLFILLGSASLLSAKARQALLGRTPHTSQTQPLQFVTGQPKAKLTAARFGPQLRHQMAPLPNFDWKAARGATMAALLVPAITVSKTATLPNTGCPGTGTFDVNCNGFVNPGDTLMYSVAINNAGTDALNVVFTDQLNADLTLIGTAAATPIAVADTYTAIGNTQLQVGSSQTITPGAFVNGNVLSNDIDPNGGTLTATAGTAATTLGGSVTMNANGTFVYTPPLNTTGTTDSFTYTITSSSGGKTDTGTISFTLTNRVWYVRNNAAAGGDGRSNTPFDTLAEAQTASSTSDYIFVHRGDGTTTGQNAGITLKNNQLLIGEGVALVVSSITLTTAGSTPLIGNGSGSAITLAQTNTVRGLNIGSTTAAAITGSTFGTLTLDTVSINTTNQALNLTTGTANATFGSITSSGGTNNIALSSVAGTISLGTGALSGATGNAFDVDQGTATISYSGTVTAGSALAVDITSKTSGTVTFSGAVSGSGAGQGVNLNSNAGTTINFTGGVTLSTSTSAAFAATGGGTVSVTGSSNTLTTTTGTALNVTNTTIGASDLNFRSISANGATNGIVLNNTGTSGGLTVTGNGSSGTGGTIQSTTGTGISLTSTAGVSLSWMIIQNSGDDGINGNSVNAITLSNCSVINNGNSTSDEGLELVNSAGAITLTNVTVTGNAHNNAYIDDSNNTGGNSSISISGSSFSDHVAANGNANNGLLIEVRGTATLNTSSITSTTFRNNRVIGLQVITGDTGTISELTVSGCTFTDTGTGNTQEISADFATAQTSNMTYKFLNNTITNMNSHGFNTFTAAGAGTGGTLNATIDGNTIGNQATTDSGSRTGNGMRININGGANARVKVNNNTIHQIPVGRGIEAIARNGTGGANFTITNNTITAPTGTSGALCGAGVLCPLGPIVVQSNDVTVANSACSVVSGNTAYDPTTVPGGNGSEFSVYLIKSNTSTHNYEGNTSLSALQNLTNANPNAVTRFVTGSVTVVSAGTCIMPPAIAPLIETDEQLKQQSGNTAQQSSGQPAAPGFLAQWRQWLKPVFSAFTTPMSFVSLDRVFEKTTETLAPTALAAEFVAPPANGSEAVAHQQPAQGTAPTTPAKTMLVNSRGEYRIVPTAALSKLMAGELITLNGTGSGFTLPAGESTTVMFNAQISSSFTGTSIANTASAAGSNFATASDTETTPVIQAPTFTKAFNPATIVTSTGVSTLTFTLVNPNPSQQLTTVAFTDALPSGVVVAATPAATSSGCGSPTWSPTAAATSLSFSGGTIAANGTCTVSVNVRSTSEGAKVNTSSAATSAQANASDTASATLTVINAPTFTKAFGASSVPLNGTAALSFFITNNSTQFQLNGIGFTDTLPAGLVVNTPNGLTTTCNGTASATAEGSSISLSGATLAASSQCSLTVIVRGTTTGAKDNSATLTTTELGATSATTGTVTLNVLGPPTIAKAFSPTSIFVGGTFSQLTFTINNPNASGTLTGVGFTDNLPSGLEVASTPNVTVSNCGGSTDTSSFTAGATALNVANAAVTVGTACTIRVNVIGTTPGAKDNTTGAITSTEGGTGNTSNTATLNVFTAPQIAKSFGASVIPVGGTTTVTFVITNPAANPGALTTITFIDSLPSGLVVGNPNGVSNTCSGSVTAVAGSSSISLGGASITTPGNTCQVQVNVTGNTAGVKNNSVTVSSGNGGTGNTAMASLTVADPPTISKAFAPSLIAPGGTSTLTITLTNPNAALNLTGAAVTDTLPAGVTTVGGTAATTCGGTASQTSGSVSLSGGTIPQGSTCTLSVNVTSTTNNTYSNTIAAGALSTNEGANASPASATLTVANPPTVSKAFAPNPISSGGTSTLTITLSNPNSNVPLTLSSPLTDTLPVNVTTVAMTAATTCSGGTPSQLAGSVTLTGGTIPVNSSCTLSVDVTSSTAGGHLNTIAAGALVTNGGANANPATATLVVGAVPQVTKDFTATALKTGATTTLTISITNNNAGLSFNDVSYTDTLPAGLTVPDAAATGACGGTLTVASNVITLTGATIAPTATCTTTFTVTGATAGVKNNTVTVDTSNFGTGYTGTDSVTVYDVPTLTKSFTPNTVPFGGTSTLGFVLSNPNSFSGGNLTGLAFTDVLPNGVTVGTDSTSACGGTLTTTAPNSIVFSGGTLGISGPGNTCTINVTVTGTQLGMHMNTVAVLTSTQTGTNTVNATATLTVTQSPTTTTIISDIPDPSVVGEPYAVGVTVAASMGGMGTPSGTVNVGDGTGATCTITLNAGAGSCNLTSTSTGAPKTLTAAYLGDTNFATSSTTAFHTVNKANTTLSSLTHTPTSSVVGEPYTVGFTLSVTNPGAGTPTGTVTVTDGTGGMCTATLPTTSCQLTSTTASAKTLTFTYNGDANFNTSTNTTGHQVNKASTTVAITDDTPDPSVFGENYAVTASVSVTAPGDGTPTGSITVTDGTNNCTITLPQTSCNLPSISVGAKTLTATYSGDTNFTGSGPSAGVMHTVNKADVNVTITSDSPDSSAVGQNVTVGFTVAAAAPGVGMPSGTVTVTVSGGSETCTGSLMTGSGSCTLVLTVPGSRTLTATYNGDSNFNTGTDTEPHTVVAPPTIAKAFTPSSVPVNGVSTLTITITNPAVNTVALTGVGFTDIFPAGLVVAATPNLTNTCGGTPTGGTGGASNLGLSGGTVGVTPNTCTVSVNVTPTVQGPFINTIANVSSTNGGTSSTGTTATLLTNLPPVVNVVPVTRAAGSITTTMLLANVSDDMTPVASLTATVNNAASATVNGVTISGLVVNAGGQLQGQVLTACNATNATFTLNVTDSANATTNATLNVTVPANPGPTLSYASPQSVVAGQTLLIPPATGPSDNGNIASIVVLSSTPPFGGTLAVHPVTGVVTVSNATPAGSYNVIIRATDQCDVATNASFMLNVTCPTITLNPGSLPGGQAGVAYSQTLSASPAGGGYGFTVTGGALPPGLTLAPNGALSGTPTTLGTFNFAVTATGFGNCTGSQSYTIVITCPTISLTSLPGGTAGTAYNQTVTASPAGGNYSFAVTGGTLPPGLTLASNGALTGTPTTGGTFNFTVTATGFGSCTGSQSYSLVIACPTISLSPASLPNGTGGTAYNQTLSATPSGTTYSFAVTSGTLPPGLTLASGGALTGTPSQAGTFTFTVTATGFGTCTGTKVYTVTITCPTITLTAPPLPNATVSTGYNQSVSAQPSGTTYSYAITSGTLPAGLSLNAATGALTGTPTTAGSYSFTVTATGFNSCTGSQSYTLTVVCPTITLNPTSLPGTTAGVAYNQTLTVTPAGTYSFSLTTGNLPPGLSLNATTGVISGLATATGTYNFTVKATAGSCFGTRSYSLVVSCPTITVNPTSLPNGAVGTAYSQTLTATPASSYSFTRTSGTLPPGLTLNSAGALTGTPTAAGSYTFIIQALGFGSCTGARSYTVVITASCPTITLPASLPNGTRNTSYYGDLTSTTPSGSYTFSLLSGTLPPGVAIDNFFGALIGTPNTNGTFNFTLKATRSDGCNGSQVYSVTISGGSFAVWNDFDGDRKADLVVRDAASGDWTLTLSATGTTEQRKLGTATDVPALGDYDGDGRWDLAVYRASAATLLVRFHSGLIIEEPLPELTNAPALTPVPADYDGDGKTDFACWEAGAGAWQIRYSATGRFKAQYFGAAGDLAAPADYDGDGRADLAVYTAATGRWQIAQSSDGANVTRQFGEPGALPLPGDYDGDGRADLALWQPRTATLWLVADAATQTRRQVTLGLSTASDLVLPGDYDGDGKRDLAIWRAALGKWFFTTPSLSNATNAAATGQQ